MVVPGFLLFTNRDSATFLSFRLDNFVATAGLLNLVYRALGKVVRFHCQFNREFAVGEDSQGIGLFVEDFVLDQALRSNFGSRRQFVETADIDGYPISALDIVEVVDFGKSSEKWCLTTFESESFTFTGSLTLSAVTTVTGFTASGGYATTDTLLFSSGTFYRF